MSSVMCDRTDYNLTCLLSRVTGQTTIWHV